MLRRKSPSTPSITTRSRSGSGRGRSTPVRSGRTGFGHGTGRSRSVRTGPSRDQGSVKIGSGRRPRPRRGRPRRGRGQIPWKGLIRISVRSTLNNLFLVASTRRGGVLHRLSVGSAGFPGPRRPAPLSAEQTARHFAHHLRSVGFKRVEVHLSTLLTPGSGRLFTGWSREDSGLGRFGWLLRWPTTEFGLRKLAAPKKRAAGYSLIG
jgi:ribosomal protein S11